MPRLARQMMSSAVAAMLCPLALSADLLRLDFEQGPNLKTYSRLDLSRVDAAIVDGGPDGVGHCLRITTPQPSDACPMDLLGPIKVVKNLILEFDHREQIEEGFEGAYHGMCWYVGKDQWFWSSDSFSSEWRRARIEVGKLRPMLGYELKPGVVFSHVRLYGRVKDKTAVKGATKAKMTVWIDNLRLYTGHLEPTMAEHARISYSNPPMFNWAKSESEGAQRLQYSLHPAFPQDATVTVEVKENFYLPPRPLEPGKWYWRVWSEGELYDGWSQIEIADVLPQAHRFTTKPMPVEELTRMPRPRLLRLAQVEQPEVTAERKAQLVKSAESLYKQGVPEHPGPHVEGDPRWPTWIDWYGKVAGRITGGTGRRLQTLARYAMLTGDPRVIGWVKESALEACKWDPEGGSAMRLGDIGAHHLLRGLNWCYDVCHDAMTDVERERLKSVIVQRARQFAAALNPFRGGEANNHAWLRALGLAESGIVLAGDHDESGAWTEYVRQLYLGRFLCCLGYQGDNNEGVAYWNYGLGFIIDYADLLKATCDIDLYQHPWLKQTARFPMYCAPPNAWAVSFADTGMPNHGLRGPVATAHVRKLALRTRDPYALWYSGALGPVDGIAPRPPVDLPQSIHYRHIGWTIFNTSLVDGGEGVTVAMHSGQYQAGHQHPDQNHFVINAYGEKLAIDGGYYDWYGSPHFKAYSMTTLAHNTLLVDDQGQAACKAGADGQIKAYYDSPGYGYTVGDASDPDVYGGKLKQFDRRILFIKPGFVVIDDLVASSAKPSKYDWLLHAVKPIDLDAATSSFSFAFERAALLGRFLAPAGVSLKVTTGFPVEPVNRYSTDPVPKERYFPEWTLHARPKAPVQTTEYQVVMQVRRLGEEPEPVATIEPVEAGNGLGARITCGDRVHLVLSRPAGRRGRLRCAGLETDGNMAAIELDREGKVRRSFVAAGTLLRYNGQVLFRSDDPRNWSTLAALPPAGERVSGRREVSGPLPPARVDMAGAPAELEGYQRRLPDSILRSWWGKVETPRSDRYEIVFDGWTGKTPPRITLDGRTVELSRKGAPAARLWVHRGAHLVSISGRGVFQRLRFVPQGVKLAEAVMLPKDFTLPAGAIVVEAEKPTAEGRVKGRLMKKVAASGGIAHCVWDTPGQWAEWTFAVAKAGEYELLIRGCSEHDEILRELLLDGKPLSPEVGVARMTATGGWCRTTDDWRYFLVCRQDGRPASVPLSAGKHTLRMVQRGGSMNVDLLALRPAG